MHLARDAHGLARLVAIGSPGDAPSIRLLEHLGMTHDATVRVPGDEGDVRVYGRSLA